MSRLPFMSLPLLLILAVPAFAGPGGGPPHRGGGEGPGFEHREARMLEAIERLDSARHKKVIEVREARPVLYRRVVVSAVRVLRERGEGGAEHLGAVIDQTYELHTALNALDAAPAAQKETHRTRVEAAAGALFDLRQQARRAQLARMEERLERLRTEIESREGRRDELVRTFVERLDRHDEGP